MPLGRLLPLLLVTCLLAAPAAQALNKGEEGRIVEISGEAMPHLLGKDIRKLSLLAMQNGRFRAQPMQFVERTKNGLPFFPTDDTATAPGDPNLLDPSDRLVFQLEDAGSRFSGRSMQRLHAEIEIQTSDGPRYAYLADPGFLQNNRTLVKYDEHAGVIGSDWFELNVDPRNLNIWKDFFYRTYNVTDGARKRTLLDTMKVRLSSGIFTKNNRMILDNDNLDTRVMEIRRGPVQTEVFAIAQVEVARVPVLNTRMYYVIQPRQTDIYVRFKIPAIAAPVLEKPAVSMAIDGNRLEGGQLWTSWGGDDGVTTDGRIDSAEVALMQRAMPTDRQWLLYDTGKNFLVLASMEFKEGFDIPMSLVYKDSRRDEDMPERFIGQWPNVGFRIDDLPIGRDFFFRATMSFNDHRGGATPNEYARQFNTPLVVRVTPARPTP